MSGFSDASQIRRQSGVGDNQTPLALGGMQDKLKGGNKQTMEVLHTLHRIARLIPVPR